MASSTPPKRAAANGTQEGIPTPWGTIPGPPSFESIEEGLRILALGADTPTGLTPKDVVWTRNKTTLYRYRGERPPVHKTPIVFVYALINKPYIFDLRPENSFFRHLLGEGYDVFLVDWGTPGWEDRQMTYDDYVGDHLPKAVDRALRASGADEYTLFGYCMGGTMSTMHAALRPERMRNLITLTTPIDFSDAGLHGKWLDERHYDPRKVAQAYGNVPGSLIDTGNAMLRPVANYFSARMTMWERLLTGKDMTSWKAMNKWVNDGVPFAGAAYTQWITDFYQGNRLAKGEMTIRGERVDLSRIEVPLLNIAGEKDHIVLPAMAEVLNGLVSSKDNDYLLMPAGHVGLLAGSGARKGLWPKVTDWLSSRSD
jgi:polyhydroxyalkanoate synthase